MKYYDPMTPPDVDAWEALEEGRRIELVLAWHRKANRKSGNEGLHATIHVIVENQILLGDETPVEAAIDRLMGEGLDRHNAIHAVGSVLIGYFHGNMTGDANEKYFREVAEMTAEKWYALAK